jgi:hypothetical protein
MARASHIRKRDLANAFIEAAAKAGVQVRIEITADRMIVIAGGQQQDQRCEETSADLRKLL